MLQAARDARIKLQDLTPVHVADPVPAPLLLAAAILVAGFLLTRLAFRNRPIGHLLCQLVTFAGVTVTIVAGGVVPFEATPPMPHVLEFAVISTFKVVWWLAGAWLLAGLARAALVFRRKPVDTRFLQDLCAGFIYVSATLGIISYVFGISLGGLLAASGIVAIVLGLALQSTLGDLFSGVVLNLAKPYHPGDWITLEDLTGRVIETNWRATQLLTLANDVAIIPNSLIAKTRLVNASKPGRTHGVTIVMRVDPVGAPLVAVAILETAMLGCNEILQTPKPYVTIRSLDALALECELTFFVALYEEGPAARNEVFDRAFRHCLAAGLRPAPPVGNPLLATQHMAPWTHDEVARRLLDHLPVFASLSPEERTALVPRMIRDTFKTGETLLEEDIVAPALFILTAGVLVASKHETGVDVEMLRLAPGECFGQTSALVATRTFFKVKALTRATVYRIARADLTPLLLAKPALVTELEQVATRRIVQTKARAVQGDELERPPASAAARITSRLRVILGFDRAGAASGHPASADRLKPP